MYEIDYIDKMISQEDGIMSANLEIRVDDLEIKTDSLEKVLGQFISSMNLVMTHMRTDTQNFKKEVEVFKREVRADTETFKREVRADTEAFKKEVQADNERLRKRIEEVSEKIEEVSQRMEKETKALKRRVGKDIERFSKKMGTMVEDMVAPNMGEIAGKYFNDEEFQFFGVRIEKQRTDRTARKEFDVIAVSEKNFYISEAKSKPRPEDVRDFLDTLEELGDYFPESRDKKVIPIFSTFYIPENIKLHLTRNRIYAMGLSEGTMDLLNFDALENHQTF